MRSVPFAASLATLLGAIALTPYAGAQSTEAAPSTPQPPLPDTGTEPSRNDGATVRAEAIAHYERSRAYYAGGRYRAAINELEESIRLDPSGYNLYFDLGLVYERIGDVDRALLAYRNYLAHVQDPAERERAERIVHRLRGARAEIADIQYRPGRADPLFWGVSAGALAALVTGGVVLFSAIRADSHVDDLRHDPLGVPPMTLQSAMDSASAQHVVADVALATGAALGVAAALLYFARPAPTREVPVCLTATVSPTGAGGGLVLRF